MSCISIDRYVVIFFHHWNTLYFKSIILYTVFDDGRLEIKIIIYNDHYNMRWLCIGRRQKDIRNYYGNIKKKNCSGTIFCDVAVRSFFRNRREISTRSIDDAAVVGYIWYYRHGLHMQQYNIISYLSYRCMYILALRQEKSFCNLLCGSSRIHRFILFYLSLLLFFRFTAKLLSDTRMYKYIPRI